MVLALQALKCLLKCFSSSAHITKLRLRPLVLDHHVELWVSSRLDTIQMSADALFYMIVLFLVFDVGVVLIQCIIGERHCQQMNAEARCCFKEGHHVRVVAHIFVG